MYVTPLRCCDGSRNMRAIYATRGVASGEIVPGVSDIDLVVIGDWDEEEHSGVVTALRRLSHLSPLYDGLLWQSAHSLTTFHSLYETDFFYQCRFDQGRSEWKLLHGDDVVAGLPRCSRGTYRRRTLHGHSDLVGQLPGLAVRVGHDRAGPSFPKQHSVQDRWGASEQGRRAYRQ